MPRRASIAIHLFLTGLLLPPLHYYVFNMDKRDERFAWRMFSPVRTETCGTQVFLAGKPIKLSAYFHNAWLDFAQRGRQGPIGAMAQRLCDDHPDAELRVRILCEEKPGSSRTQPGSLYDARRTESDAEIEVVARGSHNFCNTGAL